MKYRQQTILPAGRNHLYLQRLGILLVLTGCFTTGRAQQVDSIFFNLYTDSLKKGVYNYINIDAKMSNGQWKPLTAKEIIFSASDGRFEGNCLVLDTAFKGDKVRVTAVLKSNPSIKKETTIYIKKIISNERLKTVDEILNNPPRRQKRNKKTSGSVV